MNKKGFTMVELLAVMAILVLIALFAVPSIISITKQSESNDDLYDTIYMAAETYIYNNYDNYKVLDEKGHQVEISVMDLINNEYLKSNIKNPLTNEKFTSNDYIIATRDNDMTLSFEIK